VTVVAATPASDPLASVITGLVGDTPFCNGETQVSRFGNRARSLACSSNLREAVYVMNETELYSGTINSAATLPFQNACSNARER